MLSYAYPVHKQQQTAFMLEQPEIIQRMILSPSNNFSADLNMHMNRSLERPVQGKSLLFLYNVLPYGRKLPRWMPVVCVCVCDYFYFYFSFTISLSKLTRSLIKRPTSFARRTCTIFFKIKMSLLLFNSKRFLTSTRPSDFKRSLDINNIKRSAYLLFDKDDENHDLYQ